MIKIKVTDIKVYDLAESIVASGFPMQTKLPHMPSNAFVLDKFINGYKTFTEDEKKLIEKSLKRVKSLSRTGGTEGHNQFLTGIRVAFNLTCSNKMWVELERYRFVEFVSSQSTMHRIGKFNLKENYNSYVDPRIIEIMEEKRNEYNMLESAIVSQDLKNSFEHAEKIKQKYLELLYSNPAGFEITARLTTNYRALKTVYHQRKNHKLPEWREFCNYIEELPLMKDYIL